LLHHPTFARHIAFSRCPSVNSRCKMMTKMTLLTLIVCAGAVPVGPNSEVVQNSELAGDAQPGLALQFGPGPTLGGSGDYDCGWSSADFGEYCTVPLTDAQAKAIYNHYKPPLGGDDSVEGWNTNCMRYCTKDQPSNSKCGNGMHGQCYGGDVCVSRHIVTGAWYSKCKSTDGIPEFDPPTPPSPDECIAHHCKGGCLQPDTQNPGKQICHTEGLGPDAEDHCKQHHFTWCPAV